MSLYLCVFQADAEVAAIEVGGYSDFGDFRDAVANDLEGGRRGSRFPILMNHADAEGQWPVEDLTALHAELSDIAQKSLSTRFFDTEGRPLAPALAALAAQALAVGSPILFQ
jgi:hypothetical protein